MAKSVKRSSASVSARCRYAYDAERACWDFVAQPKEISAVRFYHDTELSALGLNDAKKFEVTGSEPNLRKLILEYQPRRIVFSPGNELDLKFIPSMFDGVLFKPLCDANAIYWANSIEEPASHLPRDFTIRKVKATDERVTIYKKLDEKKISANAQVACAISIVRRRRLRSPGYKALVLFYGNEPIGRISCFLTNADRVVRIRDLLVDERFRSAGLAKHLIYRACSDFQSTGIAGYAVTTDSTNNARYAYESRGFRLTSVLQGYDLLAYRR